MKDKEICILSTRPLDRALIEKASFQNITIDTVSFIEVKKMVSEEVARQIELLSKQKATVVFTSMNAVEIVVETVPVNPLMPDWQIYCIGGATFTLVKKYWPFEAIAFTAKDAAELAAKIVAAKVEKAVFFCGNQRREELPAILEKAKIIVEEWIVYETIETPVTVQNNYDAVLFFSPSAVHSFFSTNEAANAVFFAIGNTTAAAIKQFASNNIIVSDFPAKDQLVDKAIKYFSERAMGH